MKRTELSFLEGFTDCRGQIARANGAMMMAFDWDLAAAIINQRLVEHPDLIAEAGLQGDWSHTGGCIFSEGKPVTDEYTYLSSNWATPTLILSWDGEEQEEINCFCEADDRFNEDTKWDDQSLAILNNKTIKSLG